MANTETPGDTEGPETGRMADVTKAIRGYGADTREYAANTRIDIHAPNSVCRVYASSRGNIKGYQSSHKYSQIRGLDIRRYADIRGHSHRFTVTYPRMPLVTSALHTPCLVGRSLSSVVLGLVRLS